MAGGNLDPIKLKYNELLQEDPEAAQAFAQQNGLQVGELDPGQQLKSASMSKIRQMIGAPAQPAPTQMNRLAPGLASPSTNSPETGMVSTGKTPEEIQDRVMQSVREAQARQAALRKLAGTPSISPMQEEEENPLKKKKRPTLETYSAEE